MMDFAALKRLTIPEGEVVKISVGDTVLWQAGDTPSAPAYKDYANNFETGRLNSSGNVTTTSAAGAVTCTDYIPFTRGTVVRIRGYGALTDYFSAMYGTGNAVMNVGKANALTDSYATYAYDSGTGTVTLTAVHASSSTLRVSGIPTSTTEDIVITVNEEIT